MIPAPILVGIELNPGPLTPDVRKEIAILKRAGLSNKKIAKTLQKNIKTVKRWVNRASAKPSRHDQSKVFNSKSSSAIARSYQTQWRTNKLLTSYSTTLQTKTEITGVLHILREKAKWEVAIFEQSKNLAKLPNFFISNLDIPRCRNGTRLIPFKNVEDLALSLNPQAQVIPTRRLVKRIFEQKGQKNGFLKSRGLL